MKRLMTKAEVKTNKDHEFDFNKVLKDFKKTHKLTEKDLKDKSKDNPVYQLWNDYMFDNYPIWSMSSVAYILRGWSYLVGGGYPYYYTGYNAENGNSESSQPSGDIGDMGGGEI